MKFIERMVKRMVMVYWGPILAVILFFLIARWMTGEAYFTALWDILHDATWWADSTYSLVVFTVLVTWAERRSRLADAKLEREKYLNWALVYEGMKDPLPPRAIYWRDVRELLESPYAFSRFFKSNLSNMLQIKTRVISPDETPWLRLDEENRRLIIDFNLMRDEEVEKPEKLHDLRGRPPEGILRQ